VHSIARSTMMSTGFCSILLLVACLPWTAVAAPEAIQYPKSVILSYQIVGSPSSSAHPLATVLYDPVTLKYNLGSWTPPNLDTLKTTTPTSPRLVRILLPNGSSTVASLATFDNALNQNIDLWLSPDDGTIFSAAVTSTSPPPLSPEEERLRKKIERAKAKGRPLPSPTPKPKSKKAKKAGQDKETAKEEPVKVNLIPAAAGPAPILNTRKPPQVDADGREIPASEEQPEKTFFQKYWWLFLLAAIFTMGSSGGGEK